MKRAGMVLPIVMVVASLGGAGAGRAEQTSQPSEACVGILG
jgi:hypothetical protein